ncbi:hypothetical protein KDW_12840 [Dictyobacter vulcani]|uniref:Uncharacterized protein n=1 Tax=Dictyobacter vulcani TaxID=2607529 RepID=A0A5J4KJH2_9CHLR|nr:hypothetical protein [Dictyobacter vulcani]GER87122.1 hypothetical protein KDW_12840 [Dictyobacter vulcani]
MFWFNYRPGYPRRRRMRGGWYGFPWLLFAIIGIASSRFGAVVLVIGIIVAAIASLIYMSKRSATMNQQPPYYNPPQGQQAPYYQPPYYQPTGQQPHSQEEAPSYTQSYQQGYQYQPASSEPSRDPEPMYRAAPEQLQDDPYQPKAEYPQQMPPM